jgi:hypothetical protein
MKLEIIPEPTADERMAIEAALAGLLAVPSPPRSAWWEAGVAEASDDYDEVLRTSPGP